MEDFQPRRAEVDTASRIEREVQQTEIQEIEAMEVMADTEVTLDTFEVAKYFNADLVDYHNEDKVNFLIKEMRQLGLEGVNAVITMQKMENRLVSPPPGMSRLDHFINYFKVYLATNKLNKERSIYEQ